jgi:hypothetical protein
MGFFWTVRKTEEFGVKPATNSNTTRGQSPRWDRVMLALAACCGVFLMALVAKWLDATELYTKIADVFPMFLSALGGLIFGERIGLASK